MPRPIFLMLAAIAPAVLAGPTLVDPHVHNDGLETFRPDILRYARIELRDPHVFTEVIGCIDVTDQFNSELDAGLNNDSDGDGFLDSSPLLLMEPFADQVDGRAARGDGLCSAPVETTECSVLASGPVDPFATGTATCLEALSGTTTGYAPPVPVISGDTTPCFTTPPRDAQMNLDGVVMDLVASRVAGGWDMAASGEVQGGLMRGFITETQAEMVTLPADIPVVGGETLASLLPGGQGNCAAGDDRDTHAGESGWWFYLVFDAERVPVPAR